MADTGLNRGGVNNSMGRGRGRQIPGGDRFGDRKLVFLLLKPNRTRFFTVYIKM